jgi:hypothetical protein
MNDQPELDLPATHAEHRAVAQSRRAGFGGFSQMELIAGFLVLVAVVWAVWITKTVTAKQDHIVSVRLADVVGDYVEMQRYSASPPEQVRVEMQRFMQALDKELQARSGKGQVVLVGEAVLSKDVEDITDSVKKAVFASGIPLPKRATAADLQRMQQQAAEAQLTMPAAPAIPAPSAPQGEPQSGFPVTGPAGEAFPAAPAATVSTFGGPNGNDGQ